MWYQSGCLPTGKVDTCLPAPQRCHGKGWHSTGYRQHCFPSSKTRQVKEHFTRVVVKSVCFWRRAFSSWCTAKIYHEAHLTTLYHHLLSAFAPPCILLEDRYLPYLCIAECKFCSGYRRNGEKKILICKEKHDYQVIVELLAFPRNHSSGISV